MRSIGMPACLACLAAGCAVSHGVRPLARGQGAVTASFGGPISRDLPSPVAFPVPITTVGYAHGLTDRTAVHGAIHPTGLAAFGVFAADAGVTELLLEPRGLAPRLMLDGGLILAAGRFPGSEARGGARLLADVQLVASRDIGRHAVYVGLDQLVQPFPSPGYFATPMVGGLLSTGRVDLQLEYMWLIPGLDNDLQAAEFVGPFGLGASSIKLGLAVHLGRPDEAPPEPEEAD
jgi:hypothetical protein